MPGRRFATSTVNVERPTFAVASGTLQQIVTYAAVSGLTGLEATIQEQSRSSSHQAYVGDVSRRDTLINIDADLIPDGEQIKIGDRIKDTTLNKTYTVESVTLVDNRIWQLRAVFKVA